MTQEIHCTIHHTNIILNTQIETSPAHSIKHCMTCCFSEMEPGSAFRFGIPRTIAAVFFIAMSFLEPVAWTD